MSDPVSASELPPASYTLDQIWAWYGDRMRRVARALVDSEDAVSGVASHVMERVALELARADELPAPAELGPWLMRLTRHACAHAVPQRRGQPAVMLGPEAPVSKRVRVYYWIQAQRRRGLVTFPFGDGRPPDTSRDRYGVAPVLVVLARRVRDRWSGAVEHGRAAADRALQFAQGASSVSAFSVATAAPVLTNAAAVVVAVALALGAPAAAGMSPADGPSGGRSILYHAGLAMDTGGPSESASLPTAPHTTAAAARHPDAETSSPVNGPAHAPTPATTEPLGPAPSLPPPPRVTTPPADPGRPPVDAREYGSGDTFYYSTPHEPVAADVDGDGDNDITAGPPWVGIECGPPAERPPVWEQGCPILEDHADELP